MSADLPDHVHDGRRARVVCAVEDAGTRRTLELIAKFLPTRRFAELTAVTMITALLSDLIVLPACVVLIYQRHGAHAAAREGPEVTPDRCSPACSVPHDAAEPDLPPNR